MAFELQGVEIDRCVLCGGTWLDAGELEQIAEMGGVEPGRFALALGRARAGKRGRRRCPRCRRRMRLVTVGEGSGGVELDRCPRGHGLWLDRGEMVAVIRLFRHGEEGAVARFFGEGERAGRATLSWLASRGRANSLPTDNA